jgi:hypothetical protein
VGVRLKTPGSLHGLALMPHHSVIAVAQHHRQHRQHLYAVASNVLYLEGREGRGSRDAMTMRLGGLTILPPGNEFLLLALQCCGHDAINERRCIQMRSASGTGAGGEGSKGREQPTLECCICMGQILAPTRLPCAHAFHKRCIRRWLLERDTCPTCRWKLGHASRDQMINASAGTSGECSDDDEAEEQVPSYGITVAQLALANRVATRIQASTSSGRLDIPGGVCAVDGDPFVLRSLLQLFQDTQHPEPR